MEKTGAETIVEHLIDEKVPYAVGLCGHGDIGLLDALYDRQDEIKTISVHHESVAGFVADAYFRVRQSPLVTFTSCGPGSANLPVALGSAMMDSSAFLAITGNVPTSQFNMSPFQESGAFFQADFPSVVRHYVKRSYQATRAEQLPQMMRMAFSTMLGGRPGPVHLDVPLNVFVERTEVSAPQASNWHRGVSRRSALSDEDLDAVMRLLFNAARPVIVAGDGVERAEAAAELLAFARLLEIPVATAPLAKSVIPSDDPLALGCTGRNGTYQANRATRNADVILALGIKFDDRSTSSWIPGYTYSIPETKLVQIDTDASELSRNYPATIAAAVNPLDALIQLADAGRRQLDDGGLDGEAAESRRRWLANIGAWRGEWEKAIAPEASTRGAPLRPEIVLAELRRALPDDAIVLSDVGAHHNWIIQQWPVTAPRTLLQSWGFASMGFGVGGVLGAHLAAPDSPAVGVVGDGGFLMFPSVIATAVEYKIPAIWLVWNNGGYISIRDQQRSYFGADREFVTSFNVESTGDPLSADFASLSRSMGGEGVRVESEAEIGEAIEAAISSGRPTVIDVPVDAETPMHSSATWSLPPLPHPEPSFGWPEAS